jgi:uridylate kinase
MKNKTKKPIIIALGGSIIVPAAGKIDIRFLKNFRKVILNLAKNGFKFIIVAGGGKTARIYQEASSKIVKLPYEDMDWIGIHATRINAHLLRTIFRKSAYPIVLDNPHKPINSQKSLKEVWFRYPVIIASGWKPGWSTDYDAVLLARRFRVREIIDAGNIPFVYNKDLNHYQNAKPIKKITWPDYQKLIGKKWIPGLAVPIDPVAAKAAKKFKIKAIVVKGTDLRNLRNLIQGKKFKGTIIE